MSKRSEGALDRDDSGQGDPRESGGARRRRRRRSDSSGYGGGDLWREMQAHNARFGNGGLEDEDTVSRYEDAMERFHENG